MAKTQFTHKKQRLSSKRILASIVALVFAFILLTSVINVAEKYFALKRQIRELALQQKTLKEKQDSLSKTNAYIATPEGKEQELREKYNVVKPGEGIIVIADTNPPLPPQQPSAVARWWNAIVAGLGIHRKQ